MQIAIAIAPGALARPVVAGYVLRDRFGVSQDPAVSGAVEGGSRVVTGDWAQAGGAQLAADSFTDTNGVQLAAHTPTAGPAWSASADWTIQSNRASNATASGVSLALQDVGSNNVEVEATIRTPASFIDGRVRVGLVLAAAGNTYIAVQPFRDDQTQLQNGEVEVIECIEGSDLIEHKVPLGDIWAAATNYQLRAQYITDDPRYPAGLVKVFLHDGSDFINVVDLATSQLFTGTQAGLYRNALDEGSTFDSWSAKAL